MSFVKALGENLQSHRLRAGLSQKKVADKFGFTTPQYVSNFERGVVEPSKMVLCQLADLYKIKKDDFEQLRSLWMESKWEKQN